MVQTPLAAHGLSTATESQSPFQHHPKYLPETDWLLCAKMISKEKDTLLLSPFKVFSDLKWFSQPPPFGEDMSPCVRLLENKAEQPKYLTSL